MDALHVYMQACYAAFLEDKRFADRRGKPVVQKLADYVGVDRADLSNAFYGRKRASGKMLEGLAEAFPKIEGVILEDLPVKVQYRYHLVQIERASRMLAQHSEAAARLVENGI